MAEHFPAHDLASLWLLAEASSFTEGFNIMQPVIESVTDSLAFQMQTALHVVAFDLLDVTPPLMVGEARTSETHAQPKATLAPKFSGIG
jgi:hypothetical protein